MIKEIYSFDLYEEFIKGFSGNSIQTSFVGAAIETAMSEEIYGQLTSGTLTNAANLTNTDQLVEYCNWVISL